MDHGHRFRVDWRSCSHCHFGACLPEDEGGHGGPCPDVNCRCVCRVAPWPKPDPGTSGYGAVVEIDSGNA